MSNNGSDESGNVVHLTSSAFHKMIRADKYQEIEVSHFNMLLLAWFDPDILNATPEDAAGAAWHFAKHATSHQRMVFIDTVGDAVTNLMAVVRHDHPELYTEE